jgi:two-component system copper resistance phosphate regulon response regulator CusR
MDWTTMRDPVAPAGAPPDAASGAAAAGLRRRSVGHTDVWGQANRRGRGEPVARLLVVDDEERIARLLVRLLGASGFEVDRARDGVRACELLERDYALVVLDLLLPVLDGFEVLRCVRDTRPGQPVLVLSALSDVESKVRCFELGAADYVTKPFALAELLARVRARVHDRLYAEASRFVGDGRLRLDLQSRVVNADGHVVPLSAREFELLAYLMRQAGRVCSRQELLEHVWACAFDPHTNVVDVFVRRLRSKLGGDVIETMRNVGYRYRLC